MKLPKRLGTCADKLFELKQQKAVIQAELKKVEDDYKQLKEHIINTLPKSDASGVSGKLARVSVVKKIVPSVKDWDKFYKYISRTKAWELLQKRAGATAIKERWENGKEVPGVERFTVVDISMNKL